MCRLLCVAATLLVGVCGVVAAQDASTTDPRQRQVQEQKQQNDAWRQEAIKKEQDLVTTGSQRLQEKDYAKAAEYYRAALNLTYEQWDLKDITVGGYRSTQPAQRRIRKRLNTSYTRQARDKLASLDDLAAADDDARSKKKLDKLFDDADVATMLKNPAKAYTSYLQVIEAANAMGERKFAVEAALKAQKKQKEILDEAMKPLDEVEKLIKAGKAGEADAKLDAYSENYSSLMAVVPDLKARYGRLANSPEMKQEGKEQEVRKKIQMGDVALLREDYIAAARYYRDGATLYPDADSAKAAAEKLNQMQNDPKIVEAMKQQEADIKCTAILLRAETMLKRTEYEEARSACRQILSEYPNSAWAEKAKEMLKTIEKAAQSDGAQTAPGAAPH